MPNKKAELVEIGPGLGDLTRELLKLDLPLKCIEIDKDLVAILKKEFKSELKAKKLVLIQANALCLFKKGINKNPYILIANLPYYLATRFILEALDDELCTDILVLVQKEIAIKFSKNSAQGILAATAGKVSLLFDIAPSFFKPVPKVISSLLLIEKNGSSIHRERAFKELLRLCFAFPRKQLLSKLKEPFKSELASILSKLDKKANIRAAELDFKDYLKIYKLIKENNG